jgi:pilus assembly protein Flp/PilA
VMGMMGMWVTVSAAVDRVAQRLGSHLKQRDGQALVEYALILALVAIVVIGALKFLGGSAGNTLNNVANTVSNG